MLVVIITEKMGWDYETYLSQPTWFIDLIVKKMEIDAKKAAQHNE